MKSDLVGLIVPRGMVMRPTVREHLPSSYDDKEFELANAAR
jgi:hypothetical protein